MTESPTRITVEPGAQEIVITRTFDAPRELVYRMFTDPEQIPHWWGLRATQTTVDRMDVTFGGTWRFVETDDNGEHAFRGVYHVVEPDQRLVYTFEYEGVPGHVLLETIELHDEDGRTRVVDTSVFQSVEDRDGMVQSGMEFGARESMDQLAELLAKVASG